MIELAHAEFARILPAEKAGTERLLSSREQEVAALVGRGLSNMEIAETLHIGARTAETHVQNIMNKLGVHNRTQIAAWVSKPSP